MPPLSNKPEPGVTVAVNVTLWPNTDEGVTDEVTVVVAPALVTVCDNPADVLTQSWYRCRTRP